ncbi:Co2+/Mg2+ efflux protein ApaG [Hyphobacterium sp. HN65]|uniref:Protein ApaG n=1 Tax=Hyphobacterium lacteum TaxID=3116575 RepID=A0ABU7LNH5_9PROT|nr:Co2+/Mg2+ efflux protein ApaG [Hyphobacterium sp. HN65]MEE2525468.1 Co2+/Mg2+ efflux protein ApaG [Hyphobacterium sp. HN65]
MTSGSKHRQYECETHGVFVRVQPDFLEDQSSPGEHRFVWSYTVEIENRGTDTVQLISRYWSITDSKGKVEVVRGPGVVGEQPVLEPGDSFSYTSGAPLETPSGFMSGCYEMARQSGGRFDAAIPAFSLDSPYARTSVH